ncbi:WD repeat-containing protein 43 [Forsythia ovata]|uniref:WD repeat-containing protein 43 n=1 Tax=Forsythia ovata TaxID=205694 RepID=A0ABD1S4K5_9LAMI
MGFCCFNQFPAYRLLEQDMAKKNKSSKRKARDSNVATADGNTSEIISNKSLGDPIDGVHVENDLNEPTMGEKLASLNLTENSEIESHENVESSPQTKPPSADSVHILLKQALRADDRALLIDCLFRQDEKVISNSVSLLNLSDVVKFLQSLISIIQLRGAVLACALPWLRSLLLQHAGGIMSQESSLVGLNSLYQLIESRVSTFNHALQLSSCMDLLYAETADDGEEDNGKVTPVIYEDNDESDNEGSIESMETESNQDGEQPQVFSDISDDEISDWTDK